MKLSGVKSTFFYLKGKTREKNVFRQHLKEEILGNRRMFKGALIPKFRAITRNALVNEKLVRKEKWEKKLLKLKKI